MATKKVAAKRGEAKKLAAAAAAVVSDASEKLDSIENEIVSSTTNGSVSNSDIGEAIVNSAKSAGAGRGRKKKRSPTEIEEILNTEEPSTSTPAPEENDEEEAENVEAEKAISAKKGRKKIEKEVITSDITEEKKMPGRRGRKPKGEAAEVSPKRNTGRNATKKPKYTDTTDEEDNAKVLNGKSKDDEPPAKSKKLDTAEAAKPKSGKGRKKKDVPAAENGDDAESVEVAAEDSVEKAAPKKRGRKQAVEAPEKSADEEDVPVVEKPAEVEVEEKKEGRKGKRGAPAAAKKENEEIATDSAASKKRGQKSKKAKVDEEQPAAVVEEEQPEADDLKQTTEVLESETKAPAAAKQKKQLKTKKATKADDEAVDGGKSSKENTSRNRKRAAAENKDGDNGTQHPSKEKKVPMNNTNTTYNKEDFELAKGDNESVEDAYNLKISSWNVAGLRSWLKKDGLVFLDYEQPDIFCIQETKCTIDQMPEEATRIPGYHPYWLCKPGGYAGVAIYSKIMPINVEYGIGDPEHDDPAGRVITAEYEKFFLICVYVPNSGRKLVNLDSRMRWETSFQKFVTTLDAKKAIIICGDMNVSHEPIDLANPKSNTKSAGFTKEEREQMTKLLSFGFVDTFRDLYPNRKNAYTYWTYMSNARARNIGWRLDYFIVSERLQKRVVDNCIRSQCLGSDHCPITLFLKL